MGTTRGPESWEPVTVTTRGSPSRRWSTRVTVQLIEATNLYVTVASRLSRTSLRRVQCCYSWGPVEHPGPARPGARVTRDPAERRYRPSQSRLGGP